MKGFRIVGKRKAKLIEKINDAFKFLSKHGVNVKQVARQLKLTEKPVTSLTTKELTGALSYLNQL